MTLRWLLALMLASLHATCGEAVDVYLLGGQSNMQGLGKVHEVPASLPREWKHIRFWNGKEFEPLHFGQSRTSTRAGEFGPEYGLALGLPAAAPEICIVKFHASGMPLHHGWNAGKWQGGEPQPERVNFYPGKDAADPNQGTLYHRMVAQFRAALARVRAEGKTPVVRGFVWMQGEQDAKHELSATNYASSLRLLRDRLVADVGAAPDMPFVFGQVLPHEPALERFTHRTQARAAMAAADSHSGKPEAIPHARMVSTDGLGLLADTVHYNTDGQLRLGRAFAAALQAIAAERASKPAPRPVTMLSFNILEAGQGAAHVGFPRTARHAALAEVIRQCDADVIGVQECGNPAPLLKALGTNWTGFGSGKSVYTSGIVARLPLEPLVTEDYFTAARVKLPNGASFILANAHWSPPRNSGTTLIQQRLRAGNIPADPAKFAAEILAASDASAGPRGYERTLAALRPWLAAGERVVLTGDFNESSHLDWTVRAAERGLDRWVQNPTSRPLRFAIQWHGSHRLAGLGLRDAYRTHFPDEVAKPGITWTPPYPASTPGRRPPGDQVLERLDLIYFAGPGLELADAAVVGESPAHCEIVFPQTWPSDHRAVLASFRMQPDSKP